MRSRRATIVIVALATLIVAGCKQADKALPVTSNSAIAASSAISASAVPTPSDASPASAPIASATSDVADD